MDDPILDDSAPRHLTEEIQAAARCSKLLERMGVRITFRRDPLGETLDIEARDPSGQLICPLSVRELFDIIFRDRDELEAWVNSVTSDQKKSLAAET